MPPGTQPAPAATAPPPSGTVTFLFTDIEGSTQRWEDHPEAMAAALERHDVLLRAAIEGSGGHVFKTMGDAFCAAFAQATDALGAAIAAQRAVAAEDWAAYGEGFPPLRSRMGIHTGQVTARGGDYFGPPVNRVARLEAAGHGGQVLLSLATRQLAGDGLPQDCTLRDWGEHRLKDLRHSEHIYQLLVPGLLDVSHAPRTAESLAPRDRVIVADPDAAGAETDDASGAPASPRAPEGLWARLAAAVTAAPGSPDTVRLTAAEAAGLARARAGSLEEWRLGRIAEWSQPRYRLDGRFVELSLLVDQGEEAVSGRWAAKQERYDDLGKLLEAVPEPAIVLLGPPGSGKSTLLRHLELDLAIAALRAASPSPIRVGGGGRGAGASDRVTFFIQLNQFKGSEPGEAPPSPERWLAARWAERNPALPPLETLLAEGRMTLLLDGLNEMPTASEREFRERVGWWKDWLQRLAQPQPGNRVVFTCRTLDYSAPLSTPALRVPQVQIEPLADAQVRDFLRLYSPVRGAEIWAAIEGTPQLEALRAPFFLALLVDQVEGTGELSGDRAALFTGFVRQALKREVERGNPLFAMEELLASRDLRRIAQWQWRDGYELPERGALVPKLAGLAYGMQEAQADGGASQVRVDYDRALDLVDHPQNEDIVKAGLAISVLDEDPAADEVLYRHQLLQEYFAARILAREPNPELVRAPWRIAGITPGLREILATLPPADTLPPLPTTGWEETTLLAAAMTAESEAFIRGLMGTNLALAGRAAVALWGRGARGVGAQRGVPLPAALLNELRWALVARSRDPAADLRARIGAGLAVGELGDPRFERREGLHGAYLMPPLVEIPAGEYPIGGDEPIFWRAADLGVRAAVPRHTLTIATFEIGRYPVTNAEWACFMEAGGYEGEHWWDTKAGRAWQKGEGTAEGPKEGARLGLRTIRNKPEVLENWHDSGQIDDEIYERWQRRLAMTEAEFEAVLTELYPGGQLTEPRHWHEERFNAAAQPVVGISWYEARAYCKWLSAQTGMALRLPTEVEWESAAGGAPGRAYAYGDTFDALLSNVVETRLKRSTPVGVFVEGDTPEGVSDLSGNVFEWTASAWGVSPEGPDYLYPYDAGDGREDADLPPACQRVLRGGSWIGLQVSARAAYRNFSRPAGRYNRLGFRVVVALAAPILET